MGSTKDTNMAAYRVGDLNDPRPRVPFAKGVTAVMYASIMLRLGFLIYSRNILKSWWHTTTHGDVSLISIEPTANILLWGVQIEMILTAIFFLCYARWEDQGHLVTVWQTLYALEVIAARQGYYNDVVLMSIAFIGLYVTYFVGIYTEFTKLELARLPPFPMKKNDVDKPRYGWLGKWVAQRITTKCGRVIVTLILYTVSFTFSIFMIYAFLVSEVDDLRQLPTYKDSPQNLHVLTPLLIVGIAFSIFSMIPTMMVEYAAIPGLVHDLCNNKRASRSYRTGVWDICELDEDKDGPGPQLQKCLEKQLLDTTIVLPCYLPNEEEILPFVLEHYLKEFQRLSEYEKGENSKKKVLVVWNSPDQHKEFPALVTEWKAKFEEKGFELNVEENKNSTSKCDNLNRACDLIDTEVCCLNDADTMLDWSCIVRGSDHINNGYDIAQAMNSHCLYDCRGTPGDDDERQCHPYGILITIGDATKPQNMSTQTLFKHAPFNGRGGFWRTSSLKKVGFDHRTVGEDHDAGYRGCAYFGFKGILDMNMLCQEQEPPDCKALTSQRIRWETAALEMRRTFSWIIRSPHYSRFEIFVLLWGQLAQNCNLPFQAFPYQVAIALPLIILKGWLSIYAFGLPNDKTFCAENDCAYNFNITSPINGNMMQVALPLPVMIFLAAGLIFCVVNAFDFLVRVAGTRYRPRIMFFVYYGLLKGLFVVPFFVWVQYWALYDYCWGGAKFIATARSPVSPKKEEATAGLEKPTLKQPLLP